MVKHDEINLLVNCYNCQYIMQDTKIVEPQTFSTGKGVQEMMSKEISLIRETSEASMLQLRKNLYPSAI